MEKEMETFFVDDVEAAAVHGKYLSSVVTLEELGNILWTNQTFLDSDWKGLTQVTFNKENVVEEQERVKFYRSPGTYELHLIIIIIFFFNERLLSHCALQ